MSKTHYPQDTPHGGSDQILVRHCADAEPFPDETGYDATPTLRCELCNGVGCLKPLPRQLPANSLEPAFRPPAVICPRCKGSGIDPECTRTEIGQGFRLPNETSDGTAGDGTKNL